MTIGSEGTWRTIVTVSEIWRDTSLELLYGEVIIRRIHNLPAFLRTMSAPDPGIGHLALQI